MIWWFALAFAIAAAAASRPVTVRWYAPFLADSGFGSEATSFVEALLSLPSPLSGDGLQAVNFAEPAQFPPPSSISALFQPFASSPSCLVAICHSTPNFWATPRSDYPSWDRAARCPPIPRDSNQQVVKIGRSMFETDSLPVDWKSRLDFMDEIWVPTKFAQQVYVKAGLSQHKVVVVPEPINTLVFSHRHCGVRVNAPPFTILSIFKWEERKAWKQLLEAFLNEFSLDEPVLLWIKTSSFHLPRSPQVLAQEVFPQLLTTRRHQVRFTIDTRVDEETLVRDFYCQADAFALPSLGEGWGRPHCEAASMSLPVLYTNFSGPTEFLLPGMGFPVAFDLVEVGPHLPGHRWAMPQLSSLRKQLRNMYSMPPNELKLVGSLAAAHIHSTYSQRIVGELVVKLVNRLCPSSSLESSSLEL
ncbi:hypothetical protein BASA81_005547 [Batrachochytrium salamandrivorans]|nr:hypothetical protein BASA81_005547 [Batrachochytrium salamandrivorans]